jgi:hypothetical protein
MGNKVVLKLIDKSLVLGNEIGRDDHTITISSPVNVTQLFNHRTGEPEIAMLPLDLIFGEAAEGKNTVTFKLAHIMYEKNLEDFPPYLANYQMQTAGIAVIGTSGVITE